MSGVPGVYIAKNSAGDALYVGSTGNLGSRTTMHNTTAAWWGDVTDIEFIETPSRAAAYDFERETILELQPLHNRRGKTNIKRVGNVEPGTPMVHLRSDIWAELVTEYGSQTVLAAELGIGYMTFSDIKRGARFPSAKVIAAAISISGRSFDDLFYVAPAFQDEQDAA